jgi:Rho GTPase-activating protein RGD1
MGHHYGQSTSSIPMMSGGQRPGSQPQHERTFSHGSLLTQTGPNGPSSFGPPREPIQLQHQMSGPRFNGAGQYSPVSAQGPPQLGALPFQPSQSQPPSQPQQPLSYGQPPQQQTGPQNANPLQQNPANSAGLPSHPAQGRGQTPPAAPQMASSRPVFGVSLSRLYERDSLAVPQVVYQCIQAVDLFGLGVEGIYRLSGSVPHVNKLKTLFDTGMSRLLSHSKLPQANDSRFRLLQPRFPQP